MKVVFAYLMSHVSFQYFGVLAEYFGGHTKHKIAAFKFCKNPMKWGFLRNRNEQYIRI